DVQADAGLAFLAIAASAAGDVEGHGAEVALLDVFNVAPGFNHLAGDLVTQHQSVRRRGAAANHVLVAAADIGGDDFENDAVLALTRAQCEFGVVDIVYFYLPWSHVGDPTIACH